MKTKSTLVSEVELRARCESEGIKFSEVCVLAPRWAESKAKSKSARSALVRCDLILRDDNSAVYLDGSMGLDSIAIASSHIEGKANKKGLSWEKFVKSITRLP